MLQKTNVSINFSQGLETKTDPKQLPIGKFLDLENSIFTTGDLLNKRNGYRLLTTISGAKSLTTFNGNLTAVGSAITAYSSGSNTFVTKGSIQPLSLSTLPLIRNNLNQIQCDSAIAPNGLICTAYSEQNGINTAIRYVIADSVTGQNIVAPQNIPVGSGTVTGSPRVFIVGTVFVIVFTNVITATSHLQYIAISSVNPSVHTSNADIAASYISNPGLSWDGVVFENQLFIAYNTTSGGQSIKVTYLTSTVASAGGAPATATTFALAICTLMSMCVDATNASSPVIYAAYYDLASTSASILAVDKNLNQILAPTSVFTATTCSNITCAAQNAICTVFDEVVNAYAYDSTIPTHYIQSTPVTQAGSVGSTVTVIRSVGLASKAFIVDGVIYFLSSYQSTFQPTYFLINGSDSLQSAPVIAAKLAYENGYGYLTLGLPSVYVSSSDAKVAYLNKDLISALTTDNNSTQTTSGGIYSQTGVNLALFTLGVSNVAASEIGNDLLLSGGFGWMYDGFLPVEQNFFVWPDSIEATWTENSVVTPTGTFTSGSTTIVVSSATGVFPGMTITDTTHAYIPAGTTILSVVGTTVTISQATTNAGTGDSLSIQGNIASKPDGTTLTNAYYYQVTYEWADNQGNIYRSAPSIPIHVTTTGAVTTGTITLHIPYLRLTYKTQNPVKIVVYRWSVANQTYHQVTSLTSPQLNSTTSDALTFVDTLPDSSIIGNNIIYTTGGVIENINPPASSIFTLFDDRFWLVDSEDQNLLWYSKQVIESTPVEMSDLLTIYVAPTIAAQGSTGPITALSVMDDKLIIFKNDAIYYINGTGPDNTGSNGQYSEPIFITGTVGCANPQSIVFMQNGLMFQSDKGIWLLGRDLSTQYIGSPVEAFNEAVVQSAVNVPKTTQVRFTLSTGITLMYDYYYGQWGTFTGVPAISSCLYQGLHTFLNSFGQIYQENPSSYVDGANPVLLSFKTSWIDLSGLQGYMRAYFFYLLAQYYSPHKLQVQIAYDYNDCPEQTTLITPTNFSPNYGLPGPYGQTNPYGGPGNLEQWRVFLQKQRCQAIQLTVTEVFDPSLGVPAGQGFSMSGINLIYSTKKGWRPMAASQSVG